MSAYAASKFALEAISENPLQRVRRLWDKSHLGRARDVSYWLFSDQATTNRPMSEFYKGTATEKTLKFLSESHGKQPGDPVKAAEHILDYAMGQGLAEGLEGYLRLPLGKSAIGGAKAKAESLKENFEAVTKIAESCDY